MSAKRRIVGVAGGLALVAAGAITNTTAAYAYPDTMDVCVSVDSTVGASDGVSVYDGRTSFIYKGQCAYDRDNIGNNVEVTIHNSDAHAYKVKASGGSYGVCHEVDTDPGYKVSDPPNVALVYYKLYAKHGCLT